MYTYIICAYICIYCHGFPNYPPLYYPPHLERSYTDLQSDLPERSHVRTKAVTLGIPAMPPVMSVSSAMSQMLVDNGFVRPEYTSCGKNAVVYYGQIEAMLNGHALTWEQRVADLASKQPEHSWDEKYATKVGYTGGDMLGLGCNVLVGGRYKAGPPVLIPRFPLN